MTRFDVESKTRKYDVKGYRFLSFMRNLSDKYGEKYWMLLQKLD